MSLDHAWKGQDRSGRRYRKRSRSPDTRRDRSPVERSRYDRYLELYSSSVGRSKRSPSPLVQTRVKSEDHSTSRDRRSSRYDEDTDNKSYASRQDSGDDLDYYTQEHKLDGDKEGHGEGSGLDERFEDEAMRDHNTSSSEEEQGWVRKKRELYCEICECQCNNLETLQTHFAGTKHKKKLSQRGLSDSLTHLVERPKDTTLWNKIFKCALCKLLIMGADVKVHTSCSGHQEALEKMTPRNRKYFSDDENCFKVIESRHRPESERVEGSHDDNGYTCNLCRVTLPEKRQFELHLKGKKHQKKMRWAFLDNHEDAELKEQTQFWCSVCMIFTTDKEILDIHFTGRQHAKMLKKKGVSELLIEELYGGEDSDKQKAKPDRSSSGSLHWSEYQRWNQNSNSTSSGRSRDLDSTSKQEDRDDDRSQERSGSKSESSSSRRFSTNEEEYGRRKKYRDRSSSPAKDRHHRYTHSTDHEVETGSITRDPRIEEEPGIGEDPFLPSEPGVLDPREASPPQDPRKPRKGEQDLPKVSVKVELEWDYNDRFKSTASNDDHRSSRVKVEGRRSSASSYKDDRHPRVKEERRHTTSEYEEDRHATVKEERHRTTSSHDDRYPRVKEERRRTTSSHDDDRYPRVKEEQRRTSTSSYDEDRYPRVKEERRRTSTSSYDEDRSSRVTSSRDDRRRKEDVSRNRDSSSRKRHYSSDDDRDQSRDTDMDTQHQSEDTPQSGSNSTAETENQGVRVVLSRWASKYTIMETYNHNSPPPSGPRPPPKKKNKTMDIATPTSSTEAPTDPPPPKELPRLSVGEFVKFLIEAESQSNDVTSTSSPTLARDSHSKEERDSELNRDRNRDRDRDRDQERDRRGSYGTRGQRSSYRQRSFSSSSYGSRQNRSGNFRDRSSSYSGGGRGQRMGGANWNNKGKYRPRN